MIFQESTFPKPTTSNTMAETAAPVEVAAPAPVEAAPAPAAPAPLDLATAVRGVLKTALAKNGLARGLHECAKALDRGDAIFCLLAADCDEKAYVKLVEALCAARHLTIIRVPTGTQLGEWCGLCKIDRTGEARKVVRCSCAVVCSLGSEVTKEAAYLNEQLKDGKDIAIEN